MAEMASHCRTVRHYLTSMALKEKGITLDHVKNKHTHTKKSGVD